MNKYLDKIASSRLIREISKGSIKDLRDKLPIFANRGFLRRPSVYSEGMIKGTDEINALNNTVISKSSTGSSYRTSVLKDGKHIIEHPGLGRGTEQARKLGLIPKENTYLSDQISKLVHQQGLRHEAYESTALRKLHDRYPGYSDQSLGNMISQYKTLIELDPANKVLKRDLRYLTNKKVVPLHGEVRTHSGKIIGNHADLSVLGKESNDVLKNPYLQAYGLQKVRRVLGEAKLLEKITGKRYGTDKFTNKDLLKLEKFKE